MFTTHFVCTNVFLCIRVGPHATSMQGIHGGGATNNGTQEEEGSQEGIFLEDLVI
jgi:hypothetical protein